MLRINLFSIFTIKTPGALNGEDTVKCTLLLVLVYITFIGLIITVISLTVQYCTIQHHIV